jgi:DNA-binding NtrC family response regulator
VKPTVLLVEDEAPLRTSMRIGLGRAGLEILAVGTMAEAFEALTARSYDAVLTDLRLPDGDGLEVLTRARARDAELPVIVLTAYGTIETAVEAMQRGAHDFLEKPFSPDRLALTVNRALETRRLRTELRRRSKTPRLVGGSPAMAAVRESIQRAAASRAVLVLGETGTGKELAARAIHAAAQPEAAFVVVNCAALGEALLESELFGHAAGAFTGATGPRRGLLAEADGGTVFFDEIGEVPLAVQAKLLRFMQFGEVRPIGSNQTIEVRAKVVAATHRDLEAEIRGGRFREDLFYRLDVMRVMMPPLRERLEDLPELVATIVPRLARALHRAPPEVPDAVLRRLAEHHWPGNVRELENALERALLGADGGVLPIEGLLRSAGPGSAPGSGLGELVPLAEIERRHVLAVLDRCGGDRSRTAEALGVARSTLRRKLIDYGLHEPRDAED